MKNVNNTDNCNKDMENTHNTGTRVFAVILMGLAVLLSNGVIRGASSQLLAIPITILLGDSNAFAQHHDGSSHSDSNGNHVHDHGDMEMQSADQLEVTYEVSDVFESQLTQVFPAYFHIQFALSHDNAGNAKEGAEHLQLALSGVDMSLVGGEVHMAWMKELNIIKKTGEEIAGAEDIQTSRAAFKPLSKSMISVAKKFGITGCGDWSRFHCPMADNSKGADWLQNKPDNENPFFGSSMLKCGGLVETISAEN